MAEGTASPALPCRGLHGALLTDDLTPSELGHIMRSLDTVKKERPSDEPYYVDTDHISADISNRSGTVRTSNATWSSPLSHVQSDLDSKETVLFSLDYFRQRSSRAHAERKPGPIALLGALLAICLALYHLRFVLPSSRKGVAQAAALSNLKPHQTSSSAPDGAEATELAAGFQGAALSRISGKRQWVLGIFLLAFSLASAACLAKLQSCVYATRRWLLPSSSKRPSRHAAAEEELAELYPIKGDPPGPKDEVAESDPVIITAIRKSLSDFRGLNTRTHEFAFSLFFHLAAQSRRRQIKYSLYRKACDDLHAKVEQGLPVLSEEVSEVLQRQQELRRQYDLMVADVGASLDEENLPPDFCQQEMEFLTRDFRPALLELANLTIYSLDKDRKFLETSLETNRGVHSVLHEEQQTEGTSVDGKEISRQQEPPQDGTRQKTETHLPDLVLSQEEMNGLAILESHFWKARKTLSRFRSENFRPKVPDVDRCFLPELPLSLFAY